MDKVSNECCVGSYFGGMTLRVSLNLSLAVSNNLTRTTVDKPVLVSLLYIWLLQYYCLLLSFPKESTRESTALHLMSGMKIIRSGIAVTSLCLFLTLRTGAVGLKLVESRLTLP